MTRRGFLAAIGAAGACASLGAQEEIPRDVIPGQHALKLAEGDRDGLYYIPKGYKIGVRAPLWVVLHGAGGTAQSTQYMFGLADEFGVILIAPIPATSAPGTGVLRNWGPDVDYIAGAVGQVSRLCSVDRTRMTVAGFSDGASYSLSLGISYGDEFSRIISMSPGVMQPMAARGKPKIFISHGIAIESCRSTRRAGGSCRASRASATNVTYREYGGQSPALGTHRPRGI